MSRHPLAQLLFEAVAGRFPPDDGRVTVLPSPPGPADAVVAFSGHNVIAAELDPEEVRRELGSDDPGAAMSVPFLAWLGARIGAAPGMLDVVLAADPSTQVDNVGLERMIELPRHPRVERAVRHRRDVEAYTDAAGAGIVVLGRGLAGRMEVSLEVAPSSRRAGLGTRLAAAATSLAPADEPLFAQVSPGNVASLRAFLSAGYRPICAEVLFLRPG